MASIPLTFDSHPGWTPLSRSRSPVSPGHQYYSRTPPSREITSPRGSKPGRTPPRVPDRLSPASPGQESMRAFYAADCSYNITPQHMAGEQQSIMPTSSQTGHQSQTHRQPSRLGSRRSGRSVDHSTLLAIGSWSSQKTDHGDRHALFSSRSESARHEDGSSYKHAPYNDFILFPDEDHTNAYEDVSAYTEQPSAPLAPRNPRLRTPDIAPLSTDVQFFPCLGGEADEDRINEAWYLAGRDRVLSQMEEAMAYMSVVGGR